MTADIAALLRRSAGELAELVRGGQVTSRELVEVSLGQIEAQRLLNAFTYVDVEGALTAAGAIGPGDARPFAGVPIAIEGPAGGAGLPQANGSRLFGGLSPGLRQLRRARLRAAGFVIVGKTATPEFGTLPVEPSRAVSARRAIPGIPRTRRAARRVARRRRSRRGSCRWRTPAMAVARSASPPLAAVWSG